ncbi:MAG: alpha/beta hydrolase [Aestuariivirga sp.]
MDLIATPENPVPQGADCTRVVTNDGFHLRAMSARVGNAKGTVVILGGRADFMERYFETARDLMARGFCIASVDLRGQGGSQRLTEQRLRGHVNSFEDYDEDIRALMTQVVLPDCPPPYYMLAHSTGGNIVLRLLRTRNWFKKAVLVAPLVDLNYGAWPVPVVRLLTSLAMTFRLGWVYLPGRRQTPLGRKDFVGNPLTLDQRRWNRDSAVLEAAPGLATGGPTYGWLSATLKSIATLRGMKTANGLKCPVLVVAAGLDSVVDNEATRQFSERVAGVSIITIREALHEILLERDEIRQQFFAAFDAFVAEAD